MCVCVCVCVCVIFLIITLTVVSCVKGYRSAIRRTWGIQDQSRHIFNVQKWVTIFIVGQTSEFYDEELRKENEVFGDILQGELFDSPFEGTRKFMMAMDWITKNYYNCQPQFIIKTQVSIR